MPSLPVRACSSSARERALLQRFKCFPRWLVGDGTPPDPCEIRLPPDEDGVLPSKRFHPPQRSCEPGPVRRILPDRPVVPRRAQRLSVKVKSPESLPLSRTADKSFPSVISLSTSARERPHPSAISRTGRTGIRAAKRTEMSITSRSR